MRPEIKEALTRERLAEVLEPMIDSDGLPALLDALAFVASEKADHIRSNWQDERLAERWEGLAGIILGVELKARQMVGSA